MEGVWPGGGVEGVTEGKKVGVVEEGGGGGGVGGGIVVGCVWVVEGGEVTLLVVLVVVRLTVVEVKVVVFSVVEFVGRAGVSEVVVPVLVVVLVVVVVVVEVVVLVEVVLLVVWSVFFSGVPFCFLVVVDEMFPAPSDVKETGGEVGAGVELLIDGCTWCPLCGVVCWTCAGAPSLEELLRSCSRTPFCPFWGRKESLVLLLKLESEEFLLSKSQDTGADEGAAVVVKEASGAVGGAETKLFGDGEGVWSGCV